MVTGRNCFCECGLGKEDHLQSARGVMSLFLADSLAVFGMEFFQKQGVKRGDFNMSFQWVTMPSVKF